jgi:hypothetical protein
LSAETLTTDSPFFDAGANQSTAVVKLDLARTGAGSEVLDELAAIAAEAI